MSSASHIQLDINVVSKWGRHEVVVKLGDRVIFADRIDVASARSRKSFVKHLKDALPGLSAEDLSRLEQQLLDKAGGPHRRPAATADPVEVDIRQVIRPEQFHTPGASGITIPVQLDIGGKLERAGKTHVRYADGQRSVIELNERLEVPGVGTLYVCPSQAIPVAVGGPAWSANARKKWLEGEPAPTASDLFRKLCIQINRFIDLPAPTRKGTLAAVALWIMLTYCYLAWSAIPYLNISGPIGSGKTRLLAVLAKLVFGPHVSSNMTGPALFRTLHTQGGTLLYDEAERLREFTPEMQELRSMLLAGYKRGGRATRLDKVGETYQPTQFDVYGPKALACIQGLPPVLASRCIEVRLLRAEPDSNRARRRIDGDDVRWQGLRDHLHSFALEYGPCFHQRAEDHQVVPANVSNRNLELWQPLLALAALAESHGAGGLGPQGST